MKLAEIFKKRRVLAGIAAVALAISVLVAITRGDAQPAAGGPGGPGGGAGARPPAMVTVTPVAAKDFADSIEALGTTRANETVQLTAQISEKIVEIRFEDGQVVAKEDVLVVLDNAEETANLQSAEAMLAERQSAYERAKDLNAKKIIAKENFEARQSELRQAEAEVKSLQSRIANTVVRAPFDGMLGLRNVSVGTLVQPGDLVTTIDDLSRMKVDFDVPAMYLSDLRAGLQVTGTVNGMEGRYFKGEVSTIDTQVDPVTRSVKVRAIIPNADTLLRPGLLMSVTLDLRGRQALVVPEGALIQQRDKTFVFVAEETEEGKLAARRVEIKRGTRRLGEVEVVEGLTAGQQVITTGFMSLSDGAAVRQGDGIQAAPVKGGAP